METNKKIGLILGLVLLVPMIALIAWWFVVVFFFPTKYVNYTFNIDKQKVTYEYDGEIGTYEKCFWEINIHENMYEVVINSIWDESESSFKSYCIQFISNGDGLNFEANYSNVGSKVLKTTRDADPGRGLLWWKEYITRYRNVYRGNAEYKNLSVFTYVGTSVANEMQWQEDNTILDKMLADDFKFLIQIGSGDDTELYGLSPYNNEAEFTTNSEFYLGSSYYKTSDTSDFRDDYKVDLGDTALYYDYKYYSCDILYILERIFDYCSGMQNGTDGVRKLVFGDYFQYYSQNNFTYTKLNKGDRAWGKVNETVQTAFASYVKIDNKKASSANDSLIGWYKGFENFGVSEENSFDYTTSSIIYKVSNDDFVFDNGLLVLCDEFKNSFGDYSRNIRLKVEIDFSDSKFLGYENIEIDTGDFFVYKLNNLELNQKLNKYVVEVK